MIVVVTPNPAVDMTWRVDELVPGGSHRAPAGEARAGGKGLNVARVAHSQGAPVHAITTVGGATGEEFAADLASTAIPATLVPVAAPTRRTITVVDNADATIVLEHGTTPSDTEWQAVQDAVDEALAAASVLVISGSFAPGTPSSVVTGWVRAGRERGIRVIVDSSGDALLAAAAAKASLVKPNRAELEAATGIADPLCAARELVRRGVGRVLVSLGAEGMMLVDAEQVFAARLAEPIIGNPTGAGDAGVAACAVLMAAGERDPIALLRRATAWSAAAVRMPLAGDIAADWEELERALLVAPLTHRKDCS